MSASIRFAGTLSRPSADPAREPHTPRRWMIEIRPVNQPADIFYAAADLDRHPDHLVLADRSGGAWFYCIRHNYAYRPDDQCYSCANELADRDSGAGVRPVNAPEMGG